MLFDSQKIDYPHIQASLVRKICKTKKSFQCPKIRVESWPLDFENSRIASHSQLIAYRIFFAHFYNISEKNFRILNFDYKTLYFTKIILHDRAQKYVKVVTQPCQISNLVVFLVWSFVTRGDGLLQTSCLRSI